MRFLLLALFAALAAGCQPKPKTESRASAGASQSSAQTPGQRLDAGIAEAKEAGADAAMTAKVRAALANDVGLKTLNIEVHSNAGVVTLQGQVDSLDTKQRAQQTAQSVAGVAWVQNKLSIAAKAS
ncbi:MAG TPA: BON domain-containing protein [Burkholderiales bacterium]|nr:BON domain-containing protein [Burkholderiales bacterium]